MTKQQLIKKLKELIRQYEKGKIKSEFDLIDQMQELLYQIARRGIN